MRSVWPFVICLAAAACKGEEKTLPAELSVSTESLDFGDVALGESASLDVTLTNAGGLDVSLLSVTLIDGDQDVFSITRDGDVVAGGGSLAVTVTFEPEDEELYTGQVQIRTDDETLSSILVVLRGLGAPSNVDYDGDGYTVGEGDCDDGNDTVYPGADEGCDGRDTDCDGVRPAAEADDDGDGWLVCEDDCDDTNRYSFPDAPEICDGFDNDCDGTANENTDEDGDGFTICQGDCDPDDPLRSEGLPEVCGDGVDNDCNTFVDDVDEDGDGHSVCSSTGDCDDDDPYAYPIVVSPTGNPAGRGTDLDPVDSIATAFGMLDTTCRLVVLQAGTYPNVDLDWTNGTIEIAGQTGDADDVVLQAAQYARHFTVTGGAMTLRDLSLTGGEAAEDGGAVQVSNASLTMSNVEAYQNSSTLDGGAVSVLSGTLDLRRGCRFEDNVAGEDGGAIEVVAATLTDRGTTYRNNQAPAGRGGGLSINGGTASVEGVTLRGNSALEGGGLAVINNGDYQLEDCVVQSNSATDGGGVALRDVSDANGYLRNTVVQDNVASNTGGGLAVLGFSAAFGVVNNTFTGNDAAVDGSAIGVAVTNGGSLAIASNVCQDNDGPFAIHVANGVGAQVVYNTAYLQNSGQHFGGEVGDAGGDPLDATNAVRNPQLRSVSDDGNPDNDDLTLQGGSPEIDDGPPDASLNDPDGSRNDRGFTGGPGAG